MIRDGKRYRVPSSCSGMFAAWATTAGCYEGEGSLKKTLDSSNGGVLSNDRFWAVFGLPRLTGLGCFLPLLRCFSSRFIRKRISTLR